MIRQIWRVLILLVCLTAGVNRQPAAADSLTGPLTVYQSAEYEYLFWWDPTTWRVLEQSTSSGADWISLTDGEVTFSVFGFTAPGITPEECVASTLSQVVEAPDVVQVEALDAPGASPHIEPWADFGWKPAARVEFIATVDTNAGRQAMTHQETCFRLGESGAFLWLSVQRPVTGGVASDRDPPPANTLVLPSYFVPAEVTETPASLSPLKFSAITTSVGDLQGSRKGLLTLAPTEDCASPVAFVVAEGTGYANFVLDPARFSLTAGELPVSATWLLPNAGPDQSVVLREGAMAVLRLEFPESMTPSLWYTDPDGTDYQLGYYSGCGGAGGSMPIRVPLE